MTYSVRNGKLGFECDVCFRFVSDLKSLKSCDRCHKAICPLCSIPHFIQSNLHAQSFRNRQIEKLSYVCPDCKAELESEEQEEAREKEEYWREVEEEEDKL